MKFIIDECIKFQIINVSANIVQVEEYLLANKENFMKMYA